MEECLICGAPLEYLERDEEMECAVCHRKESSKTRCINGHYVCNDCHTQGTDSIFGLCLSEAAADPISILRRMMDMPFCHMHGPEHHVMVGAALLTAKGTGKRLVLLACALCLMLRDPLWLNGVGLAVGCGILVLAVCSGKKKGSVNT